MNTRVLVLRFGSLVVVALVLGLLAVIGFQVSAQDDAPTNKPEPARTLSPAQTPAASTMESRSAPDIEWTVSEQAFTSNYPAGFAFTATIRSSAGPIARGRVIWSHAPGTQRSRSAEIDPKTGILTATWIATGQDAVPPWVGLSYYWDVGDADGNSFQTDPVFVEYEDTTHDWLRAESEDVIVFTTGLSSEVSELAINAMAAQRETYRQAWGDLLPYTPRVILFGNWSAWQEWQVAYVNSRVIGITSTDWGGTAQVAGGGDLHHLAYGTVLHEIAHLYQSHFTIMIRGTWVIEGNATFFELDQQYDYEQVVRNLAAAGNLPALLQGTGPGVSGRNGRRGYDIGYTFFKWLTDTYGLDGHRQLIELLDTGMRRNEAIETVTGLSIEEVESRWRVWLGASPVAPTLIPTPTIFWFASPTPYGQ
ncbi:MAG: hypothetical protein JXJ20_03245 [Anaerolineae bacterium]|nr:hypothetical protein [Anaerolineae bacterium]